MPLLVIERLLCFNRLGKLLKILSGWNSHQLRVSQFKFKFKPRHGGKDEH